MFRHERRSKILDLLDQNGRVEVEELAKLFNVSVDSIRKDLQHLAKQGKVNRVYGGATRVEPSYPDAEEHSPLDQDIIPSLAHALPAEPIENPWGDEPINDAAELGRLNVARRAYLEINSGDSIFLDVSRTNSLLADLIARGDKRLIVTTNMLDVMQKLSNLSHVTVLGTGGYLNVKLNGFVGSATVSMLEPLLFVKAFIGASGIDLEHASVTSNNIDSGSVKERVIHNASYKFLLADESKFGVQGHYRFASLDDFSAVITDASDPEILRGLQRAGVPVLRSL